ncbi:ABC transporter transmembrane domain-containing protein [Streptomyces sp. NPDC058612]|uniref:ABC transporter transmembrane domain-containing protein n=1 Tax=Streptomyces sp. NPDC058612 TaxID=3346555 RepID=UPI003647188B
MRPLPVAEPGNPDIRSATRYLLWLAGRTARPLTAASFCGLLWLGSQALMPVVIREAIDEGLVPGDMDAVLYWSAVLLGLGVVQALSGTVRRRLNLYNALSAGFRTVQLVVGHANRLGASLERRVDGGEMVSIGTSDMNSIGNAFDIVGRTVGAVFAVALVAVVLLDQSASLALMLLVALPAIILLMGYTLRPLHRRQGAYRDLQGELTSRLTDVVAGLRVLRGVGGETSFARSYRERSQRVRDAGSRVAGAEALIRAAQVLLPGLLVATVTWIGARAALSGSVTPGELVAFYAYAAFLVEPLGIFTETADRFARAHVAARRVVAVLALRPETRPETRQAPAPVPVPEVSARPASVATVGTGHASVAPMAPVGAHPAPVPPVPVPAAPVAPPPGPPAGARPGDESAGPDRARRAPVLVDERSGLTVPAGVLLAVVAPPAEGVRLADRLGGYTDAPVTYDGLPLAGLPTREVRRRILVVDNRSRLFRGPLRDALDPHHRADGAAIAAALRAAAAEDVVEALPDGLDTEITGDGRRFSGGQRQRLVLARALLADPDVLVVVDPTSAVDAHTEDRIGRRLRAARAGRTTVLISSSPLLLDRADQVAFLPRGRLSASGSHRELLAGDEEYRLVIERETGGGAPADPSADPFAAPPTGPPPAPLASPRSTE